MAQAPSLKAPQPSFVWRQLSKSKPDGAPIMLHVDSTQEERSQCMRSQAYKIQSILKLLSNWNKYAIA